MLKTLFRTAFTLCAAVCITACHRLSPAEEKIIGIWEFTGLDTTGRVVFHRDHTVVHLFPEFDAPYAWYPSASGTWRLEGDNVVIDERVLPTPGYSPSPRPTTRIPIRECDGDRWVRGDGRGDFIRVSAHAERYAQVLALLYLGSSLIALTASIYAIRTSAFRKGFVLLFVAAALALAYSALLLVAALAQTGDVIFSFALLRSLKLPRETLKVATITVFTIGFVRLVYGLREKISSPPRI